MDTEQSLRMMASENRAARRALSGALQGLVLSEQKKLY
jgi:hypothetical protein